VAVLDAVAIVFYAVVVQYCIFAQCFFLRFSLSFAEFSLYIFLARVWKGVSFRSHDIINAQQPVE
jgi:hypothetical protein